MSSKLGFDLKFARPATIKIDNKPITIDCALSKLIVESWRSSPPDYEISLSRKRILIKLFDDLNPRRGLNVSGDGWRSRGLA
jgi:hypothetical protein